MPHTLNPVLTVYLEVRPAGSPVYKAVVSTGCPELAGRIFTGDSRRDISEQIRREASWHACPDARLSVIDI